MATKTAARPSPSPRTPHSQSVRTPLKPSTTPLSPPSRVPASVGQPLPPGATPEMRSPGAHTIVRAQSPNYFGIILDPAMDSRDSGVGPKENWSPPTSSIFSFAAASPKPIDSNSEFEAFKRQTESNNGFTLGRGHLPHLEQTGSVVIRPRVDGRLTGSATPEHLSSPRSVPKARVGTPGRLDIEGMRDERDSAYVSSSESKRASETSMTAPSFFDIPHQQSPTSILHTGRRNAPAHLDDRHLRLSLPQNRVDPPSPNLKLHARGQHQRAETLPAALEDGPAMISPAQLKDMVERLPSSQILILDLRVFPQYSQARIRDALNLCIPTTLLKRPSFNLQKLKDTFTNDYEKERFSQWESAQHIVVYDAYSSEKKDAMSATNTLKKFSNEGWKGHGYILRGGFAEFSKNYPKFIDKQHGQDMQASKISLSLGTLRPEVAPVAGGCMIPATKDVANPFFSNIRQNQDLIGGVGQLSIKLPEELSTEAPNILPAWLLEAAAAEDHGKKVSDKFLRLELDEQSRMTKALSSGVSYGAPGAGNGDVQIAGIEKGGKNRYNNIWPFEHTRVRLQGRPEGACDYVNASHIKASRSNKRYIASQGPLPATFEDFWSVIWDQDVRVIVMLTAEQEGGQLKCHPYWSSNDYGPYRLKALSERKVSLDPKKHWTPGERRDQGRRRANTSAENAPTVPPTEQPHAIVRKFSLSHLMHPFSPMREIAQVHFSSWPDFGAPASPSQLLGLVEISNQMQRAAASPTQPLRTSDPEDDEYVRPILVHCSAGCGRTGTFCTVDSVIDMLKRQRKEMRSGVTPMDFTPSNNQSDYVGKGKRPEDPDTQWLFDQDMDLVEKTVQDFRSQRLSMVQSLRQFVLCYETILEWMVQQSMGKTGRERSGSDGGVL